MSDDLLIAVDAADRALEPRAKALCHRGDGVLHRAFSVYLFDEAGRLLLQKRSAHKALWPEYWANSCCSHPRWGEETLDAAQRRVGEELGMKSRLEPVFAFEYHAYDGDRGAEYEFCHVLIGRTAQMPRPDPREVAAWTFLAPERVDSQLESAPERYTPWLHIAWKTLQAEHRDRLEKLA